MSLSFNMRSRSCGLCLLTRKALASEKRRKVLQVERLDGKILESSVPILVEELIHKFPGAGVGLSKDSQHHLALTYQLKLGIMYYILPPTPETEPVKPVSNGVSRIKLVITKQQLEEILTKQISVEDVLKVQQAERFSSHEPLTNPNWRPELQSIPEGDE